MLDFAPLSESELFNKGVEEIDSILKSTEVERSVEIAAAKTNPSSAKDYDRIKARGYARDYSCGKCTTSPHACRNTSYPFYNGNIVLILFLRRSMLEELKLKVIGSQAQIHGLTQGIPHQFMVLKIIW